MPLPAVSTTDILIYLLLLTLRFLFSSHLLLAITIALRALPFLLFQLPVEFFRERVLHLQPSSKCSEKTSTGGRRGRETTLFQAMVLKCMRYSFTNLPVPVARCFFDKFVVVGFYYWRLLRLSTSTPLRTPPKGLWIQYHHPPSSSPTSISPIFGPCTSCTPPSLPSPDLTILYLHGGGFTLGTPHFYLEFLTTLCSLLREAGFENPAIFALQYSLAPEMRYPSQVKEVEGAVEYVVERMGGRRERVVVMGDSAGGRLAVEVLMGGAGWVGLGVLVSPWVEVGEGKMGEREGEDYLDRERLREFAGLYYGPDNAAGHSIPLDSSQDGDGLKKVFPRHGITVYYSAQEILGNGIRELIEQLREHGEVKERMIGNVHAWVVASMFLGGDWEERGEGVRAVVKDVKMAMGEERGRKRERV
ncbi:alpha/beta-hydrolase [Ascodesmis nigricans]|uniref:Alpha/beta-hydrolase n=1 Tax=Ascodesmis nigricans TaxID=341454 RepID=A0A4S2MPB0_9PEZI|nr:alpha/beta-hydrolase [Ascodesmis nigricans]